jgi:Shikimate kinase
MGNIILIGFMGAGKSTIGNRMAKKQHLKFIDTDRLIEDNAGQSIAEIFETKGESEFRDLETQLIKSMIEETDNVLLSVGGGLPMREENRELLRKLGKVIFLRIEPKTVIKRLKNDNSRPLLKGANAHIKIVKLLQIRNPVYESIADIVIDVDGKGYNKVILEIEGRLQ